MTNAATHSLAVNGRTFGTGSHITRIPVTVDLNGGPIELVTHVVVGSRPGPTLFVSSTLHGGEWTTIDVVRKVLERLEPESLSGALIALPVANQTAFGKMKRATPDESDNSDLNRVFPGPEAWITEQIAATITRELLSQADALIDFHQGTWGNNFGRVSFGRDFPDPDVAAASRALAHAFGIPWVRSQTTQRFPGPGSMMGYAGTKLGIPGIIGGVGGIGFEADDEAEWVETNVRGVFNVMRHMGILEGEPERVRVLEFTTMLRVNPTIGGFLRPARDDDHLGREVAEGEVLATVTSPYTREVLETLTAPVAGYLMYYPRWYPVRPGEWAYGIIQKGHEHTRWIELDGSTVAA